jgi:curli biogenesis system outer membrane secretion channel CsgG
MKKNLILLFAFILTFYTSCSRRPQRTYTGDLTQLNIIKKSIGENYSKMLITELYKTGLFEIVESELDEDIQKERAKLGLTDAITTDLLLTGAITEYSVGEHSNSAGIGLTSAGGGYNKDQIRARIAIDIRLVDIRTGSVLFAESSEGMNRSDSFSMSGGGSLFTGIAYSTDTNDDKTLIDKAMRDSVKKVVEKMVSINSSLGSKKRVKVVRFKGPSEK